MIRYLLFILINAFIIAASVVVIAWLFNIDILSKVIRFLRIKRKHEEKVIKELEEDK